MLEGTGDEEGSQPEFEEGEIENNEPEEETANDIEVSPTAERSSAQRPGKVEVPSVPT